MNRIYYYKAKIGCWCWFVTMFLALASISKTTHACLPYPPSLLSATAQNDAQINLTWNNNSSPKDGFRIERKTGAGGTYAVIASVGASVTSYQDTNNGRALTPSTTYYYRVSSYLGAIGSGYSNEASALTGPAMPVILAPVVIAGSQIKVSWGDVSSDESGFKIERKLGSMGSWSEVGSVAANATSYTDSTGLSAGAIYYYRVRAWRGSPGTIYSRYSAESDPASMPVAGAPVIESISAAVMSLKVNWQALSGATGYKIYRSQDGANFTLLATVGNVLTYTDAKDMVEGIRYWYKVSALNGSSESPRSAAMSGWTMLMSPTDLVAVADDSTNPVCHMKVTWMDNSERENAFVLERSPDGTNNWTSMTVDPHPGRGLVTYHDLSALAEGSKYHYRVRAILNP